MEDNLELLTERINDLWSGHLAESFPETLVGKDINGIDLVMLDSDIAGCVLTFIEGGNLNLFQTATLGLCFQSASFVMSVLNREGRKYFGRLEVLAELVLKAVAQRNLDEHLED
jgi:hypothetical protein